MKGRKSDIPLQNKNILLFAGDWERLERILAPSRIAPTTFIRKLVRTKIQQLESALADTQRPVALPEDALEVDDD